MVHGRPFQVRFAGCYLGPMRRVREGPPPPDCCYRVRFAGDSVVSQLSHCSSLTRANSRLFAVTRMKPSEMV
jgi:hypothetical protein